MAASRILDFFNSWLLEFFPSHRHPAVYCQDVFRDVLCLGTRNKGDCCRNILALAKSAQRDERKDMCFYGLRQLSCHVSCDESRSNGIYGNVSSSEFPSQSFRQPDQPCLAGRVVNLSSLTD